MTTPTQIRLDKKSQEQLVEISQAKYPNESCAVLFGSIKNHPKTIFTVTNVAELTNIVHSSVEFRVDELELYSVWKAQNELGKFLLGIFHSHPDDAYLSGYDKDTIKNVGKLYPDLVWVVFGNKTRNFRAFVKNDTNIIEIPLIDQS